MLLKGADSVFKWSHDRSHCAEVLTPGRRVKSGPVHAIGPSAERSTKQRGELFDFDAAWSYVVNEWICTQTSNDWIYFVSKQD